MILALTGCEEEAAPQAENAGASPSGCCCDMPDRSSLVASENDAEEETSTSNAEDNSAGTTDQANDTNAAKDSENILQEPAN